MEKPRSLKVLAEEVLAVQDACNLLAVINGMSRCIRDLREQMSWEEADAHDITLLWIDKVCHLADRQHYSNISISNAYGTVQKLAKG